jgi:hypothetical protein
MDGAPDWLKLNAQMTLSCALDHYEVLAIVIARDARNRMGGFRPAPSFNRMHDLRLQASVVKSWI